MVKELQGNITPDVSSKGEFGGKISIYRKVLLRNDETPYKNRGSSVMETNDPTGIKQSKKSYR